jgi:urease accessory protein
VRAQACLEVERDTAGRSVVRTLRSAAPLTLIPVRGEPVVHLVNSAASPLGGDELELTVRVGPGACLRLTGIAATVALPGPGEKSRSTVHVELGEDAILSYLPEPTVITARANHEAVLQATLGAGAVLHYREILVLGRTGERPGQLTTALHATREGRPLLRQQLTIGDQSIATLAGHRVLATELHLDDTSPDPTSGEWWSRTPLAAGGTLTTALANDAVTAQRLLSTADQSAD